MPLSIVSEIGSIKEALDKEPIPGLFGKDLSFFATEPTLLYLPGTDRIIYLNDRFTEVLGYTEQDLAVWQFSMVSLFPSNEWEAFRSLVDEKPSTEDKPASFHLRCKDGKELSCRLFCRLLYKDCWLVQLQDLPDRTTEELDRLSRELDEFAYVASHDLQEPLRKITTFIQRLQQKLKENTDEDVAMYIKRIQVSADNMRNLIDNLLAFSRAGRSKEPAEPVDLSEVVSTLLTDTEWQLAEWKENIHTSSLPVLEAIPSQMQELLHHILNNAVKFRKKDTDPEVYIAAKELSKDETKEYGLPVSCEYYMLSITDNGIGFEQQYAEKILQPFQRLHGKHEYPGTGIGLGICKKIVSSHHGYMFATGVPGEGSSFYIILPKQQPKDV